MIIAAMMTLGLTLGFLKHPVLFLTNRKWQSIDLGEAKSKGYNHIVARFGRIMLDLKFR